MNFNKFIVSNKFNNNKRYLDLQKGLINVKVELFFSQKEAISSHMLNLKVSPELALDKYLHLIDNLILCTGCNKIIFKL